MFESVFPILVLCNYYTSELIFISVVFHLSLCYAFLVTCNYYTSVLFFISAVGCFSLYYPLWCCVIITFLNYVSDSIIHSGVV